MSKSDEEKLREELKKEAVRRVPRTDLNALKKIEKKTKGK